jgi:hypothetical protein
MSPEELPRPKGPKVEPIDRRGKLMAFKQAVRKEAEEDIQVEAPANETPYERLKRLKTDSLAYRLQRLHLRRATRPRDIRGRSQTTIHHHWHGKALAKPLPIKSTSTGPKTRHAALKDARNLKKHPKARRGHFDDDFS